jgi:branched-chain amino acid aminotransferase
MLVYVDGQLVPKEEAKISVFDHGLLYGDGVFEGIRAYEGRVFRLEAHLKRLDESARAIGMILPWSRQEITGAVLKTMRANELRDAYIRLIVTRGVGDLGLDPDKCQNPSLIIIATEISIYPPEFYENGMRIITSSVRRVSGMAVPPQAKTLNYLNNIMAKIETKNAGFLEAVMLNAEGYVVECTADNLFLYRNGCLSTPPTYCGALPGITRSVVIELAGDMGLCLDYPLVTKHDLYVTEECFLTGTAAEVAPVVEIDGRQIGDGKVGAVTRKLMEAFKERTRSEGTPVYSES